MILYFSATGNSKYVAERIAAAADDVAVSIEQTDPRLSLSDNEIFGMVFPTYDYTIPVNAKEFLSRLDLSFSVRPYLFYVATYGTSSGAASSMANAILKKKDLCFDALFDIRMPDTWTPMYDLSDSGKVSQILQKADKEIDELIEQIQNRITGKHMSLTFPKPVGSIGNYLYEQTRKTRHLHVSDVCIGCGLCEHRCPAKAISLKEKKPVWIKDKCIMCLRCLHNCPMFAIYYGNGKNRKHGQYQHPGKSFDQSVR